MDYGQGGYSALLEQVAKELTVFLTAVRSSLESADERGYRS